MHGSPSIGTIDLNVTLIEEVDESLLFSSGSSMNNDLKPIFALKTNQIMEGMNGIVVGGFDIRKVSISNSNSEKPIKNFI